MAGIIKGGRGYGYISVDPITPVMKTVYGEKREPVAEPIQSATEEAVEEKVVENEIEMVDDVPDYEDEALYIREEDAKIERAQLIEEYEQLRVKYEKQSEEYVLRAKEKAGEIYEKTKEIANKTIEDAKIESVELKKTAEDEGRNVGYEDGYKKGYDEGYVVALKKCRDTLMELKQLNEDIIAKKADIFLSYERSLFDSIFEIAQKVTLGSLKQKDKAVITKMLREAGKKFRGSKNVKISLSSIDISDETEIDEELLKDIFNEGTNVEIEILKDAPEGTLIIDNGAEITDAGVQTQLKMIEQLGKGKYRDKSPSEMLRDQRKAKKQEPFEDEEGDNPPDVMAEVKRKTARKKKSEPIAEEVGSTTDDVKIQSAEATEEIKNTEVDE